VGLDRSVDLDGDVDLDGAWNKGKTWRTETVVDVKAGYG
jgi:hypothetical protein